LLLRKMKPDLLAAARTAPGRRCRQRGLATGGELGLVVGQALADAAACLTGAVGLDIGAASCLQRATAAASARRGRRRLLGKGDASGADGQRGGKNEIELHGTFLIRRNAP